MWVWREDMVPRPGHGGWRLDEYGTWTWDEHGPFDRPEALPSSSYGSSGWGGSSAGSPALALLPAPVERVPGLGAEETPIFHAVSDDHSRRAGMRRIEGQAEWAAIPEPHPGSGPLPIQHWSEDSRSGLADVPTVPPPPGPRDEYVEAADSPADELRRRAERRRRPHAAATSSRSSGGSGRHALRGDEPRSGRHSLER